MRINEPHVDNVEHSPEEKRVVEVPFEEMVRYISEELADSIIAATKPLHQGPANLPDPPQPDWSKVCMNVMQRTSKIQFDKNRVEACAHKCVHTRTEKWIKKYG